MHIPRVSTRRILVVHSDHGIRAGIAQAATSVGYSVRESDSVAEAVRALAEDPPFHITLFDTTTCGGRISLDPMVVVDSINTLRQASNDSQLILLVNAQSDLSICTQAIHAGVAGFLEVADGRIDSDQLAYRLEQAFQRYRYAQTTLERIRSGVVFDETGFVGCSQAMARLLSQATRVSQISDAPVLISGESGTGKQLLAELIHKLDPKRSTLPFFSVNCASMTGSLADSALFGHVRGAFTGATKDRQGYFRAADGGVLLLDEIGELDSALQPKLLRVLQEGQVLPVGSDREFTVDVRVIAATHRHLPILIQEGRFRLDLYQRISVILLEIPPLRTRPEDVPLLVDFFVGKYSDYYQGTVKRVDRRVYDALGRCALEGNVRELENLIRQSLAFKMGGEELELADLPIGALSECRPSAATAALPREVIDATCRQIERGGLTLADFVGQCEQSILSGLLTEAKVSHAELAKRLGVSRRTLYNKLHRFGLP